MWLLALAAIALAALAAGGGRGQRTAPPGPPGPPVPPPVPAPGEGALVVPAAEAERAMVDLERQANAVLSQNEPGTSDGGSSFISTTPSDAPAPSFALLDELGRAPADVLAAYQNRDPNVVNGPPGSGLTVDELERAIAAAEFAQLPEIALNLRSTQQTRSRQRTASREGPGAQRRVRTPAVAPGELPRARATRGQLKTLADQVVANLNASGHRQYDIALMKRFQRAAGLGADGRYGDRTRQALGHYGRLTAGQVPPSEW